MTPSGPLAPQRSGPLAPRSGERVRERGPALLLLLAALPALVASCGESDEATALDLVVEPRATVDQIDIRGLTLDGQAVTLPAHLLPSQPTRLNTGDVLRLLFDDDRGGSDVVVTAVGLYQGVAVTASAIAMGTLQTKHPVRATLVLGSGGTGGNGGAGGSTGGTGGGGGGTAGSAGTAGIAGSGGSSAGGGAAGTGGVAGGGGAGRGGTSGSAGTGGASGTGGVAGTTGRGGTGGASGTGGGGRGGSTAGTGGTTGAAGRGGTGGTGGTGTAGRGGTGGTGTAGRGGTGGTGGAPRCIPGAAVVQTTVAEIPASTIGNITECGYTTMIGGVVKYAAVNGSRFAFIRDLEFGQSAACGRCIQVMTAQAQTVATVVGSCTVIGGLCGANVGMALSSAAYSDIMSGAGVPPVTWGYVPCQVQGPVYARLDATYTRVVIQNHAYGIAKVEVEDQAGGQPVQLGRSADNFWGAAGLTLAGRAIRVTDVNGGVVSGNLQGSNADQPLAAQLPMCIAQ